MVREKKAAGTRPRMRLESLKLSQKTCGCGGDAGTSIELRLVRLDQDVEDLLLKIKEHGKTVRVEVR